MKFFRALFWSVLFLSLSAPAQSAETSEPVESLSLQAESAVRAPKNPPAEIGEEPPIVSDISEAPEPTDQGGPPIFIRQIIFEGNTVLDEATLREYAREYEGREVRIYDLQKLARRVTRLYIQNGYLTSQAYLPRQKLPDGVVTIRMIEGKLGRVSVEGNRYFSEDFYASYFADGEETIFRYQDLNERLYFLNKTEDLDARAHLTAGVEPGDSDLVLKTSETNPLHIYYEWHNRGTSLTHHSRHVLHVDHNNVTGRGDAFRGGYLLTEEGSIGGGYFLYDAPFNRQRDFFRLQGAYIESMLMGHLKSAEIKGNYISATPSVGHYFIRKPALSLALEAGAEYKDSKTSRDDLKISFDRIRTLFAGPSLESSDPGGRTVISQKTHWGLPGFWGGSSEDDPAASRPHSGGEFIYYSGSATRVQRLIGGAYAIVRGDGQWTRENLTSTERFSAGGAYSVRGYPESDSSGDYGYNFSAEVHTLIPGIPPDARFAWMDRSLKHSLQLYGFLDGAGTYNRERNSESEVKDRFLLGTGLGVRLDLRRNCSVDVAWGVPIGDESRDKDRQQIYFSVKAGF